MAYIARHRSIGSSWMDHRDTNEPPEPAAQRCSILIPLTYDAVRGPNAANNGTPQPQQTPKQQCVSQAQQTFNNTMTQINSQSIWPSVIFGASFGTLTGAAWGCVNSTFAWAMCQETWGGSALIPAINGGISGGGAMSNAQNAFTQQSSTRIAMARHRAAQVPLPNLELLPPNLHLSIDLATQPRYCRSSHSLFDN